MTIQPTYQNHSRIPGNYQVMTNMYDVVSTQIESVKFISADSEGNISLKNDNSTQSSLSTIFKEENSYGNEYIDRQSSYFLSSFNVENGTDVILLNKYTQTVSAIPYISNDVQVKSCLSLHFQQRFLNRARDMMLLLDCSSLSVDPQVTWDSNVTYQVFDDDSWDTIGGEIKAGKKYLYMFFETKEDVMHASRRLIG